MDPLSPEAIEERLALLVNGQFEELRVLTIRQDDQQLRQVHQRFAEADMVDVDLVDAFERWLPQHQYAAGSIVLPAIGLSSRADVSRLERLLRLISDQEDGVAHFIGEALQVRFATQPSLALELVPCIESETPITDRACRTWALGFAMAQPSLAAQFIVDRLGPPAGDPRATSAVAVTLPWRTDPVKQVIEHRHAALLEYLLALADTDEEGAWYCIVEMAQFDREAYRLVSDALSSGSLAAASKVARSVFRVDGTDYGVEGVPLVGIMERLVELALVEKSVCSDVDLALTSCLRKDGGRPIAIELLRELGNGPDDALERFHLTFQSMPEDTALFRDLLTTWLLSPTASFALIRGMLGFVSAQRARPELDESLFAAALPLARAKAIRRLLGLHGEGPSLCRFAANIARMQSLGDAGLEMAGQMFNLIKDEFPGATEEFLKPLSTTALRKERGAHIFRGIYATSLRWKRHLERLPRRPELRISDSDAHSLQSARAKLNSIIQRGAEEMSVFASIVTKVHVAQGRRFTSHMQAGPTPISDMGRFSQSIELPTSELSDPMRGFIHRMKMLEHSR